MIFVPFSYDKDREVNVKIYTYQNYEKGAYYEKFTFQENTLRHLPRIGPYRDRNVVRSYLSGEDRPGI